MPRIEGVESHNVHGGPGEQAAAADQQLVEILIVAVRYQRVVQTAVRFVDSVLGTVYRYSEIHVEGEE